MVDWHDFTGKIHARTLDHNGRLDSLAHEWERELAALWRLEADVNNGGYLQFLVNWGHASYAYASHALKKIGARRMAELIDQCQALVDEHIDSATAATDQLQQIMPNSVIGADGNMIKEKGSALPPSTVHHIYELSYKFMDYPDDVASLGLAYYGNTSGNAD